MAFLIYLFIYMLTQQRNYEVIMDLKENRTNDTRTRSKTENK